MSVYNKYDISALNKGSAYIYLHLDALLHHVYITETRHLPVAQPGHIMRHQLPLVIINMVTLSDINAFIFEYSSVCCMH